MEHEQSREMMSKIVTHMKYAQFLEDEGRRETWDEIVDRNVEMHVEKFPELEEEIKDAFQYVREKKIVPSMRSSQFAGEPIKQNPARLYNCSYLPIDCVEAFAETMFLLLGGTGVGYSVQWRHTEQLPPVTGPKDYQHRYFLADRIEGWADMVKILMEAYLKNKPDPKFDYSDIRPKGTELETAGGKAPGPGPLKKCEQQIRSILDKKGEGERLTPLEVHDIQCVIADAVLSGGIRRAAMISLFDRDDEEMVHCKSGDWFEDHPYRARANNSAVLPRGEVSKEEYDKLWEASEESNSGEPGFYWTNDKDMLTNPCAEISLKPQGFCNLTEVNAHDIQSQSELEDRASIASFIGTLQATYTDFHYLRPKWKKRAEKEALLGVSLTGIGSNKLNDLNLKEAAERVLKTNEKWAEELCINKAKRTTTIKPSGTSSLVLGTSAGIHAWHNDYYIRRMRVGKNEQIYKYLKHKTPELIEDDLEKPDKQAVISIPMKAPPEAITRHETPIQLLERVKRFKRNWIEPGHRSGANTHNVSATVSLKDDEWEEVGDWMWENRSAYNGLSVLPYHGGDYKQAPFEDCTKEEYNELMQHVEDIDLKEVHEDFDNTKIKETVACGGGECEVEVL